VPSLLRQRALESEPVLRYHRGLFPPPMASDVSGAAACIRSVSIAEHVVDGSGRWPRHSCPQIGASRQAELFFAVRSPWGRYFSPARANATIGAMSLGILSSNL
jgi:hypothetical protein